jgi:hypothetical protein
MSLRAFEKQSPNEQGTSPMGFIGSTRHCEAIFGEAMTCKKETLCFAS